MNLIIKAAQFAMQSHADQTRKYNGKPYIIHPARVAARVIFHPIASDITVAAAWCHDVLEDCPNVDYETLVAAIGIDATALVGQLTNTSKKEFPTGNRLIRKTADLSRLLDCSHEAHVIKLIDRADNLAEMGVEAGDFRRVYGEESFRLANALNYADPEISTEIRDLANDLIRACGSD